MKIAKIYDLKPGDTAIIYAIGDSSPVYRRKLLALGFLPGESITIIRKAPLGDPIEVSIRGSSFSLRKEESEILELILK